MRLSRTSAIVVVIALVAVSAGASGGATSEAAPLWEGRFSAPFAEDPTFDARPPQTGEEAKRVPTAVHLSMLPDGRVVYWSGTEGNEDFRGTNQLDNARMTKARTRILDLRSGTPTWSTPGNEMGGPAENDDLFCADQALLADGRLLAVGGQLTIVPEFDPTPITGEDGPGGSGDAFGSDATRWIDPRSPDPAWEGEDAHRMHTPRWYPSVVTLPDGRLLTVSGVQRLIANLPIFEGASDTAGNVETLEVFDPSTNRWTEQPSSADISLPLYPRLHVMHDGQVLYPGAAMMWSPFGQAIDEALWGLHRAYDPTTRTWSVPGVGVFGARSDVASVPLLLSAPYDETRILVAGGTLGAPPTAYLGTTLSELVTYRDGSTTSELTGPLNNPRWFSSGVLLPSGEVLAVSGADRNANVTAGLERAIRQAELYNPDTGTWTPLASAGRDRAYHNTAILLPDGRVLLGGHAPNPYLWNKGTPDEDNPTAQAGLSAPNLKDPSFEIFTPPYLDPALGQRPRIRFARAGMRYGASSPPPYGVRVSGDVERMVLVRLPSQTHATDGDQRGIELEFTRTAPGRYEVTPPPDGNVAPPGFYYLFALSETGVPSKARIVQVGADVSMTAQADAPFGR